MGNEAFRAARNFLLEFGELPKTISGKIRRVELRVAERGNHPDADASPPANT